MNIRLQRTEKKVIIDEARKTVTTLLLGIDNKSLKYVGVAKCSPEDIFDADKGAKISYKRARKAMLTSIRGEIRTEIKKGERYAKVHQDIYDELTQLIEKTKVNIEDIINN